jgi:hypothetical protein
VLTTAATVKTSNPAVLNTAATVKTSNLAVLTTAVTVKASNLAVLNTAAVVGTTAESAMADPGTMVESPGTLSLAATV